MTQIFVLRINPSVTVQLEPHLHQQEDPKDSQELHEFGAQPITVWNLLAPLSTSWNLYLPLRSCSGSRQIGNMALP